MSTTNHTLNYGLSQYVDGDVTSYLTNYNSDMTKIDAQMKRNADSAQTAENNATIAVSTAAEAASNASTALTTANSANETAESAQTAAQNAQTASGEAQTDAAAALRASASNSITNLAPAYDSTLTYAVGDLVTYIFPDTNHGHLYKCIVAVTVPEEFDVNKWDDVTTSEVFERKDYDSITITADGVKTFGALLDDLNTVIDIDRIRMNYSHVITNYASGEYLFCYRCSQIVNTVSEKTVYFSTGGKTARELCVTSNPSKAGYGVWSSSWTDETSDVLPAGTTIVLNY